MSILDYMHVQKVKEPNRQYLLKELHSLRVTQGQQGERLQDMDYYSLRSLLATKRAAMN